MVVIYVNVIPKFANIQRKITRINGTLNIHVPIIPSG